MDFGFSDEQEALRSSVRDVLAQKAGPAAFRRVMDSPDGFDPGLWKTIASLGWTGIAVEEEHGGLGLGMVELAIVLEETGRAILPAPFLSTVGLAAPVVAGAERSDARSSFLERLARGELRATLAFVEDEPRWDPVGIRATADRSKDSWKLAGRKAFVPDAHQADEIVVACRTGSDPEHDVTLFLVPAEALREAPTPQASMDNTRRFAEVSLDGVVIADDRRLGPVGGGWPILSRGLDRAAVALSAEACGVCLQVLDLCVAYAKEREQFGRKIGSFQAVSHQIADQLIAVECARSNVFYAAWTLDEATPDASLATAAAKSAACDAAHYVTNSGIQVHGGIGFTWEHDMHLYYRRAKWDELYLGDARYWRERIASLLAS